MLAMLLGVADIGHAAAPLLADDDGLGQLTLLADPSDGGSVSGGGAYATGQTVNLRASAATGFVFTGWTRADGTEVSNTANFAYTKQEGDEVLTAHFRYNPSNPNEPVTPVFPEKKPTHSVSVSAVPADGGSVSVEKNVVEEGTQTRVRASAASSFQFLGWYVADTLYSKSADFYYTMGEEDIHFEARFQYNPGSPNDPPQPDIPFITPDYNVSVTVSPADGGSANTERSSLKEGEQTRLRASAAVGFRFTGWYVADTLYNTVADFYYTMGQADILFEARFRYDPGSPNEPPQPDLPVIKPKHQVTAEAVPADGGSVSVGTGTVEEGQSTRLSASGASGFVFLGWYANDSLYSQSANYDYTMEQSDIHFEARFQYNPGSPNEPSSPDTHRYELYLTTMRGMPGRTIQYPVYLNALDTLKDMHFQLNFPEGTIPDMENIRLSGKAVGYTLTYEKVEAAAEVRNFGPLRAGEDKKLISYAMHLIGGTTPPCNTRLLTINLSLGEDFSGNEAQQVSVNQISMTDVEGNTETASARHGSLIMREASELGNIFYLTINATGFGSARVGSKHIRNSVQVIDFVENSSANVYFVPDDGYHLEQVLIGEEDVTSQVVENRLFIASIQDDINLEVTFAEGASASNPLTVTATGNGVVTYIDSAVRDSEQTFDVSYGSEVVLNLTPDKGHHLANVTVNEENAMEQVADGHLTIESMTAASTIAATFEPNLHTVTFAYADTVYSQLEVAYGETIAVPENPTLKGHTFAGWKPEVPTAMPDSSMTFTAKFTVNQYTATFSIPSEDWEEVLTLDYGSTITPPTPPTKPGYTFVGWDKEIPATMPDSAIVFTGSYTQDFVALTLTATGNGTVTYDTNVVREGTHNFDVAKLSTAVLTFVPDAGHHLSGVTVDGEDAMSQVSEGRLSIVNITDSTSVYVTFEVNQYLVTFAYADTVYSQLEVAYGETIAVPENPTLKGHTFAGWKPEVPTAMPDSSMTFTAKFTVNQYTATFSIPSEDWEEVLTLDYGSTITPPTPPTKPGYTFVGWDKEIPATMPDSAIVLIGSYTQNMVKLSLTASGQGTIVFGDENVRNETKVFEVAELSAVELTIREDLGSLLERVSVNEEDRTAELDDNKTLRLGGISEDTNVEVLFIEQSTSFTLDGLQYIIPDVRMGEIVLIGAEDMEHITIPNEVEYGGKQWAVTAIADSCFDENPSLISIRIPVSIESVGANLFKGCVHLAAINWEAKSHLTSTMMGTLSNPNLLLYIDRIDKAPVEINNVISLQSLTAERITLSDANVPGDFYCPTAFIAKEISYSHEYLQQTLSDKCQGWESIVLPFDVQIIKHETQGEIHPFATLLDEQIVDGDRPFWLYRFTEEGHFKEADGIRANEPYILSMPNEPELWDIYKLNGRVTFSAANVMVEPTADVVVVSAADRMFLPCYRHEAENTEWYLLNVGDAYDGHAEGAVFSAERPGRSAHPFEAYFEATGSSPVKGYYEIFEKENMNSVHSVQDIERNGDGAVYGIGGEKISNLHTSFSTLRLKRGLYIMPPTAGKKGRKVVVK